MVEEFVREQMGISAIAEVRWRSHAFFKVSWPIFLTCTREETEKTRVGEQSIPSDEALFRMSGRKDGRCSGVKPWSPSQQFTTAKAWGHARRNGLQGTALVLPPRPTYQKPSACGSYFRSTGSTLTSVGWPAVAHRLSSDSLIHRVRKVVDEEERRRGGDIGARSSGHAFNRLCSTGLLRLLCRK